MLKIIGPGVVAALANNDAGGMLEYATVGAKMGFSFFIPLLFILAPVSYIFQERIIRLGASTKKDYHAVLKENYGHFACFLSVFLNILGNMLYIATEFIGICAPLTLLGVPFWVSSIFAVLIIFWLKEALDNKKIERVTLIIGLLNLAFIAALILAKPDFSAILRVLTLQDFFPNVSPLYLIIIYFCATMGNCIAPFMLIFQSDNSGNTENLKKIRVDLAIGSVIQPIFASLIMSCGAVLYGIHINAGFENLILAFGEKSGQIAMIIFAVGLFNSALLAGVTIAIANASLPKMIFPKINKNIFLLVSLILCAIFVCLKIGHMTTIVLAQIFGACVLIPDIFYLAHLTSKKNIMGKNKNTKFQTFITYLIGISFIFVAIFSLIGAFLA